LSKITSKRLGFLTIGFDFLETASAKT